MSTDGIEFKVRWPASWRAADNPLFDATFGRFEFRLGSNFITHFRTDRGDEGNEVHFPLYQVAEWFVENWWALLNEPKKTEDEEENPGYRSRHWLGEARNGFALPDVWFFPTGEEIEVSARSCYLRFSRISFTSEISESVTTVEFEKTLKSLIEKVINRLDESHTDNTPLHNSWALIQQTQPEEKEYCRLIGALGLSPYDEHPEINKLLVSLSNTLSGTVLYDLCQAVDEEILLNTANLAKTIYLALPDTKPFDLAPLSEVEFPVDTQSAAWRWGLEAVNRVRKQLKISERDPLGGDQLFEALNFDPESNVVSPQDNEGVMGGVAREATHAHVAIAGQRASQNRFTAARAAFMGWSCHQGTTRLVTAARTRHQQASRAFAAEMLAPISYIRTKTEDRAISDGDVEKIAEELRISPTVVKYQASNNRIRVTSF